MNGAQCTLEVYNFLREGPVAGHLFVWVHETKAGALRMKKKPQVELREWEQRLIQHSVLTPQQNFREDASSVGPHGG